MCSNPLGVAPLHRGNKTGVVTAGEDGIGVFRQVDVNHKVKSCYQQLVEDPVGDGPLSGVGHREDASDVPSVGGWRPYSSPPGP